LADQLRHANPRPSDIAGIDKHIRNRTNTIQQSTSSADDYTYGNLSSIELVVSLAVSPFAVEEVAQFFEILAAHTEILTPAKVLAKIRRCESAVSRGAPISLRNCS
ncbi:unnamed protein product, partial [Amoebophrya sp. A120]